ncbi:MAG: hypothetical protein IJM57_09135 [Lachnospiraceae bacterium]|nr:hypothetical protein [Lachnospiraceae bacterium]
MFSKHRLYSSGVLVAAAVLAVAVWVVGAFAKPNPLPKEPDGDGLVKVAPTSAPLEHIEPRTGKDVTRYSPFTTKKVQAPRLAPIRVDGMKDNLWNVCEPFEIGRRVFGNSGASGSFCVYADKSKIYLWIEVTDLTPHTAGEVPTRKDGVEIFLNEDGQKSGAYGVGDAHYRISRDGALEVGSGGNRSAIEYNVVATETGYVVEASVRWTLRENERNSYIGFDIRVNDSQSDGSRDWIVQWSDTSMMTHENLRQVGTLRFAQ